MRNAWGMREGWRLVTSIDINEAAGPEFNPDRRMSISALHELELAGGRRVILLDDRGWSSSGPRDIWSYESLEGLTETARAVVGPDEPPEGRSYEDEAAMHWAHLAANARAQGVMIEAYELARLPHEVEVSLEIRARLTRSVQ